MVGKRSATSHGIFTLPKAFDLWVWHTCRKDKAATSSFMATSEKKKQIWSKLCHRGLVSTLLMCVPLLPIWDFEIWLKYTLQQAVHNISSRSWLSERKRGLPHSDGPGLFPFAKHECTQLELIQDSTAMEDLEKKSV